MANIDILSWNLLNLGVGDLGSAITDGPALVNYIGLTIATSNADVVCLQEIVMSVAGVNLQAICDSINAWSYANSSDIRWTGCGEAAFTELGGQQYEGYAFFWKTSIGMTVIQCGLYPDLPGNNGYAPGRGAVYLLAEFADSPNQYLFMNYHAPSASPGNTVALAEMTTVWNNATSSAGWGKFDPPLTASPAGTIICGDFNVDYLSHEGNYQALASTATPLSTAITQATSLTAINSDSASKTLQPTAAQVNATETDTFTVNAYDHFLYSAGITITADGVMDCITCNFQEPFLSSAAALADLGAWQTQTVPLPINNSCYTSFILYRYAVSDHLPIFGSFTLP